MRLWDWRVIIGAGALAGALAGCPDESPVIEHEHEAAPEREAESETEAEAEGETEAEAEGETEAEAETEAAASVDLLHAVRSELSVSSAFRADIEQVRRLTDGDMTTAWNSATDDLTSAWIGIALPREVAVESIQMTSGFTKTSGGRDLFAGNHRVRRVRISRDGESLGEHALDPESRELQTLPVRGPGGVYRIEVAEVVPGQNANWREICISELRVMGRPGSAGASGVQTPSFRIGAPPEIAGLGSTEPGIDDPEDEEGGEMPEDELPGDEQPEDGVAAGGGGPELHEADGLRLTEISLATAIEGGQPVDPRTTFSKVSDERVYCFVRLDNVDQVETSISIGWERADRPSDSPGASLRVPAQERYRTFAFTGTRRSAGRYRCVVRSEAGSVLGRAEFELTE